MSQQTKKLNYQRPYLYPKQLAAFFNDFRYCFIEAGTKCFEAGTLIKTDKGLKPIEKIKELDLVLSFNGESYEYKPVFERFRHLPEASFHSMVEIQTIHGIIKVTEGHLFWFNGATIPAIELVKLAIQNKSFGKKTELGKAGCQIQLDDIVGYRLYKKKGYVYSINVADNHNYCIGEAGYLVENCGKTSACMVWLYEQALQAKPEEINNFWWVAPTYMQASIAYQRYIHTIPKFFIRKTNINEMIELGNGAILWFKTGEKPDNLYGDDVRACVQDEASRQREEAFFAIRSTLTATNGLYRGIGNVKGRGNWFFKMCRKAEAGEPNMHYAMITASDAARAGVISWAEIDDARATLPDSVFEELYMCKPADTANNPFGYDNIAACTVTDGVHGDALSHKKPVCWGWDVAKSVDWTVGIALDEDGRVCGYERFQLPYIGTKAQIIDIVGDVPYLIDATGAGNPFVEMLQQVHGNQCEGFVFTAVSKQQLMEGLAAAIKQHLIKFPDGAIVTELEQFEWKHSPTGVRYSAPQGFHDDCVCSLALAWRKYMQIKHGNNLFIGFL